MTSPRALRSQHLLTASESLPRAQHRCAVTALLVCTRMRAQRLKHAKRKLLRGNEALTSPREGTCGSISVHPKVEAHAARMQSLTSPPYAAHGSAVPSRSPPPPAFLSSCTTPPTASPVGERTALHEALEMRSPPPASAPPTLPTASASTKGKKSSRKSSKARRAQASSAQGYDHQSVDIRSHTAMTVSMKASHPSPRLLGLGDEETFE